MDLKNSNEFKMTIDSRITKFKASVANNHMQLTRDKNDKYNTTS